MSGQTLTSLGTVVAIAVGIIGLLLATRQSSRDAARQIAEREKKVADDARGPLLRELADVRSDRDRQLADLRSQSDRQIAQVSSERDFWRNRASDLQDQLNEERRRR